MSKSAADLEREAEQHRARLAEDVATLRQRLQPSEIAASVQEAARAKAAPVVERLRDDTKAYGGALSLAAGAVGAYLSADRTSSATSSSTTSRSSTSNSRALMSQSPQPPLMPANRALLLLGAGMAVGVVLANRAPMTEEEKRLFRAVGADVKRAASQFASRQFNTVVRDDTSHASLFKMAATAFTLLAGKTGRAG